MGGFCHTAPAAFLFITLISVLLNLCLQPQLTFCLFLKFILLFSPHSRVKEGTVQSGVCE